MHTCFNHSIVTKTRATAPRVGESCYNGMLSFVVTVITPSPHTPLHHHTVSSHSTTCISLYVTPTAVSKVCDTKEICSDLCLYY